MQSFRFQSVYHTINRLPPLQGLWIRPLETITSSVAHFMLVSTRCLWRQPTYLGRPCPFANFRRSTGRPCANKLLVAGRSGQHGGATAVGFNLVVLFISCTCDYKVGFSVWAYKHNRKKREEKTDHDKSPKHPNDIASIRTSRAAF